MTAFFDCRKSDRKPNKRKKSKKSKADMNVCGGRYFGWSRTAGTPIITSRSVQVGVVLLSFIFFNCISLFPGDRTAVARYLCNKYPTRFQKLNSAQVYVTRVMKRAEDAVENGVGAGTPNLMADRRSIDYKRAKPVMDNLEVQRVIERICSIHNDNIKNT